MLRTTPIRARIETIQVISFPRFALYQRTLRRHILDNHFRDYCQHILLHRTFHNTSDLVRLTSLRLLNMRKPCLAFEKQSLISGVFAPSRREVAAYYDTHPNITRQRQAGRIVLRWAV
jgi:hypothetical protein